ncbi:MAG TPA: LysR family transcriptional regulator [Steroidobacteraceae bacterium]|nr:LysR family transcriptional regulator [Steroidobacteraceae bacterium]
MIDLRKLRYFIVVADERNLVRAARRLNVAQPALSRRMKDLELDLGLRLFDRLPRGIALTPAGHLLAEHARLILAQISSLPAELAAAGRVARQRVRIAHPYLARSWSLRFASLLQAIRGCFPTLTLEAHLLSSAEQARALHEGEIDLAVRFGPQRGTNGLASLRIFEDAACAARLGRGHSAAKKTTLSVAVDLAHEPLIMFPRERNPTLYDRLVAAARGAGLRAGVLTPVDHAADAWRRGVIGDNRGWTLVQRLEIDNDDEWTVCRPVMDVEVPIAMEVCWLPNSRCSHTQRITAALPHILEELNRFDFRTDTRLAFRPAADMPGVS